VELRELVRNEDQSEYDHRLVGSFVLTFDLLIYLLSVASRTGVQYVTLWRSSYREGFICCCYDIIPFRGNGTELLHFTTLYTIPFRFIF